MHYARMLCVCVAHVVEGLGSGCATLWRARQSMWRRRACAARHIDLSLLLASAAEHGIIAAGGDAMINSKKRVIQHELAFQHRGWCTPSGGSPDTTLALSRDYETSNSLDPQEGRAEVSCPAFKRAESAESAGT